MQYDKYEKLIVVERGVELVNWPDDIPFVNASDMTTLHCLRRLLTALTLDDVTKHCRWVCLSSEEWERRQTEYYDHEVAPKKHKQRYKAQNDNNSSGSDEDEDESHEEARPAKKKQAIHKDKVVGKENIGAAAPVGKGKRKGNGNGTKKGNRKEAKKQKNNETACGKTKQTPLAPINASETS
jgi:hypothetical protein